MTNKTKRTQLREAIAQAFGVPDDDGRVLAATDTILEIFTVIRDRQERDTLGGWIALSAGKAEEMQAITAILQDFERDLKRSDDLAGNAIWQDFARGFVRREMSIGHSYKTWLNWFTSDPRRMEWAWKETPETIRARWLVAFDSNAGREKTSSRGLPAGV